MNDQASTPPKFNIEQRIGELRQIEAKMKELETEFDEKIKPYKEGSNKYRIAILGWLQDNKMEHVKGKTGSVNISKHTSWRIEDIEAFRRHVIGSEDWDLIAWHISKSVADMRFEIAQDVPPGAVRDASVRLNVRGPPKPRAKRQEVGAISEEEWAKIEAQVDKELEEGESQSE